MNPLQFLEHECQQAGFALNQEQLQSLCLYGEELAKWSKKMNLVAKGSLEAMLADHFLDSLCLYPFMDAPCRSLLDVGTGAGFPGLVLGAVCPELLVTLVEPREKRVSFLRHIIRTLKLSNITIVPSRLESGMELGCFDAVTSRAFAELAVFLPLVEPYLAEDGAVLCMKGPKGEEEFTKFKQENPWSTLNLTQQVKAAYPLGDHGRCLMIFKKRVK
jgi:16S rRNA (guanine527-N7)-methyltransferase